MRVGNALSSKATGYIVETTPLYSQWLQGSGSCLGTLLLVIYIDVIVGLSLFDGQCTCELSADDMKLYTVVHTIDF